MLPHFPKSYEQMTKLRDEKLWEGYYSASPILSQIRARPQREGQQASFQDEEGRIRQIEYKKTSVATERKLKDARGMSFDEFVSAASEPGREMGREIMRGLFEMLDKVTRETGNVVNAGGRGLTPDLFLDLFEKVQFDFRPDGTPILPSLNLGSAMHAQFQLLWPEWIQNADFQVRMNRILERKREEFYEREACRRLVD